MQEGGISQGNNERGSTLAGDIRSIKFHLGTRFMEAFEEPGTIEIVLNPDGVLWQEKLGGSLTEIGTIESHSADSAMRFIARCLGVELRRESPILEGEFPLDGSRFAGQIPPAVAGPTFAIRKKASAIFTLDEYVQSGVMSAEHREIIAEMVVNHRNILVIGGTSSGKTTLTNAIIHEIVVKNPDERLLIMEDTGEIQCAARNSVIYHTTSNVSLTDLLKTSLRMRPDRILVGEVRDHAALDLLDAWNTGHEGGVATLHSNNARSGLSRLRSLVSRNPFAPRVIEEVIGEAVHCIIHIAKTPAGRRVKEILRVNGWDTFKNDYNLDPF